MESQQVMSDFQEQLANLRRRIAKIDHKYAKPGVPKAAPAPSPPSPESSAKIIRGKKWRPTHGRHFETEKLYERHRRHGSIGIARSGRSAARFAACHFKRRDRERRRYQKWCFLDTETTGLAGGSGTYAFLIGVGRVTPNGFRVRQFFMRDFGEEASLLSALDEASETVRSADHLQRPDLRSAAARNALPHGPRSVRPSARWRIWICCSARAGCGSCASIAAAWWIWKIRSWASSAQGDLPGELIPYVYFEYLRTQEIFRLVPIFHHNATDILTLACLTAIVPLAFHPPGQSPVHAWRGDGRLGALVAASRRIPRTPWRCSGRRSIAACRTI